MFNHILICISIQPAGTQLLLCLMFGYQFGVVFDISGLEPTKVAYNGRTSFCLRSYAQRFNSGCQLNL